MYKREEVEKKIIEEEYELPIQFVRQFNKVGSDADFEKFCRRWHCQLEKMFGEEDECLLAWREYKALQQEACAIRNRIAQAGECSVNDWVGAFTYSSESKATEEEADRLSYINTRCRQLWDQADDWEKFTNHGVGLSPIC